MCQKPPIAGGGGGRLTRRRLATSPHITPSSVRGRVPGHQYRLARDGVLESYKEKPTQHPSPRGNRQSSQRPAPERASPIGRGAGTTNPALNPPACTFPEGGGWDQRGPAREGVSRPCPPTCHKKVLSRGRGGHPAPAGPSRKPGYQGSKFTQDRPRFGVGCSNRFKPPSPNTGLSTYQP